MTCILTTTRLTLPEANYVPLSTDTHFLFSHVNSLDCFPTSQHGEVQVLSSVATTHPLTRHTRSYEMFSVVRASLFV
jgi:hypothetical protein